MDMAHPLIKEIFDPATDVCLGEDYVIDERITTCHKSRIWDNDCGTYSVQYARSHGRLLLATCIGIAGFDAQGLLKEANDPWVTSVWFLIEGVTWRVGSNTSLLKPTENSRYSTVPVYFAINERKYAALRFVCFVPGKRGEFVANGVSRILGRLNQMDEMLIGDAINDYLEGVGDES